MKSSVPFVDLTRLDASLRREIDAAFASVTDSGRFVMGEHVSRFEEAFASYCETDHAVAVNSGTSALHLALLAAGVGPGDEVITVPATFIATAAAIRYTGARPVFVDIVDDSLTMDPSQIESVIGERTKAVLPVHLYGQPADMGPLMEVANGNGLVVIEDAAQAHGARYGGARVGSIGHLGCFSFYPSKNLGAFGEGGIVVTNDAKMAKKIRSCRDWNQEPKYVHSEVGYNYRMDEIQGAVLNIKLRFLDEWNAIRRAIATRYSAALRPAGVRVPREVCSRTHVYHLYAIRVRRRDEVLERLRTRGVAAGCHYPLPLHLQPCFEDLLYEEGDLPRAEALTREVITLPLFAGLTEKELEHVIEVVIEETEPEGDRCSAEARAEG